AAAVDSCGNCEAVPGPLDLLDQQVDGLGWSVGKAAGATPGEDLGPPCPAGAAQPGQLWNVDAVCPAVEALQRGAGGRCADRGVDSPQQLFARPGGGPLATGSPGGE